jgi:hypothetical protein
MEEQLCGSAASWAFELRERHCLAGMMLHGMLDDSVVITLMTVFVHITLGVPIASSSATCSLIERTERKGRIVHFSISRVGFRSLLKRH